MVAGGLVSTGAVSDCSAGGTGSKVEVGEPLRAVEFTCGDVVEFRFQVGGELVVHQPAEVFFKQPDHGEREPAGHQRVSTRAHVSAVLNRGDDGRVGGWASDSQFFESFDQAGFCVPRWWRGRVPRGFCGVDGEFLAFRDLWEA